MLWNWWLWTRRKTATRIRMYGYRVFCSTMETTVEKEAFDREMVVLNPVHMDTEAVKQTFMQLVEEALLEAQMGLGFMYATGIWFNETHVKVLVYYTIAALGNNSWAHKALGYRSWPGVGYRLVAKLRWISTGRWPMANQVKFSGGVAVHRIRLLD